MQNETEKPNRYKGRRRELKINIKIDKVMSKDINFVEKREDVIKNLQTLKDALSNDNTDARSIIEKGRCFAYEEIDGEIFFAPSKFVGYKDNTVNQCISRRDNRDGRETNPVLENIYSTLVSSDNDNEYNSVKSLFDSFVKKWQLSIENSPKFFPNTIIK